MRPCCRPYAGEPPRARLPDSCSGVLPSLQRYSSALPCSATAFRRARLTTLQRFRHVAARSLAASLDSPVLRRRRQHPRRLHRDGCPAPDGRLASRLSGFYRGRTSPGWAEMVTGCTPLPTPSPCPPTSLALIGLALPPARAPLRQGLPSSPRGLASIPLPIPRGVLHRCISKRFAASTAFAQSDRARLPLVLLAEGRFVEAAGFRHYAYGLLVRSPPKAALSRRFGAGVSPARRPPATRLLGLYLGRTPTGRSRGTLLGTLRFNRRRMEHRLFERLVHAVACSTPQVVVS